MYQRALVSMESLYPGVFFTDLCHFPRGQIVYVSAIQFKTAGWHGNVVPSCLFSCRKPETALKRLFLLYVCASHCTTAEQTTPRSRVQFPGNHELIKCFLECKIAMGKSICKSVGLSHFRPKYIMKELLNALKSTL